MRDPSSEGKAKSPLTSIGGAEAKTPADRIRQIQQLQQAQQTTGLEQAATQDPSRAAAHTSQPKTASARRSSSDGFSISRADAVKASLQPRVDPRQIEEVARRQVDDQTLFVGSDVEVTGNPWKIIPFGDELPALFDTPKPLAQYEPMVPKNAIRTPEGLLFQVALKPKHGNGKPQIRTVLTDQNGKLQGAECKAPQELQRLLNGSPGLFERLFGFALPSGGVNVRGGTQSRFEAEVKRPSRNGQPERSEKVLFNNFGQRVTASLSPSRFDFVYRYALDAYEAGF